jgi:hypothetical protein
MASSGSPSEAQFLGASTLQASIVIPTHNRRDSLQRTLLAIARQGLSAERFEVLVICAGCTDGTVHMCHEISPDLPYRLHVIEQSNTGLATARNRGVEEALATPHIEGVEISVKPHTEIVPLPEGASYLGFIFARAETPAEVEDALRAAHAHLRFDIRPVLPVLR